MAKHPKKARETQTNLQELGIVTFTEDIEQARDYEILLKNNDIPVMIKEHQESSMDNKSFAIMVPEDYLDEAHVVIESQDAYDDFYDLALEDEDEDELDSDFFDDDF